MLLSKYFGPVVIRLPFRPTLCTVSIGLLVHNDIPNSISKFWTLTFRCLIEGEGHLLIYEKKSTLPSVFHVRKIAPSTQENHLSISEKITP